MKKNAVNSAELTNEPVSHPALCQQSDGTTRKRTLLIVNMTMCVACITLFDLWAAIDDVTFQNIPQNSTGCGGRDIIA